MPTRKGKKKPPCPIAKEGKPGPLGYKVSVLPHLDDIVPPPTDPKCGEFVELADLPLP